MRLTLTIAAIVGVMIGCLHMVDTRDRTIAVQRAEIAAMRAHPVAAPQPDYRVTLANLYEIEQPALQPAPAPMLRRR